MTDWWTYIDQSKVKLYTISEHWQILRAYEINSRPNCSGKLCQILKLVNNQWQCTDLIVTNWRQAIGLCQNKRKLAILQLSISLGTINSASLECTKSGQSTTIPLLLPHQWFVSNPVGYLFMAGQCSKSACAVLVACRICRTGSIATPYYDGFAESRSRDDQFCNCGMN